MKRFIYPLPVITFCLLLAYSCTKKLDQQPQTAVTDVTFWKSTNDLALACNYLYSYLPGLKYNGDATYLVAPFQEMYGTDTYAGSGNSISDGSWTTPATSTEWTNYYKLIRAANNILEKSVTVTGDTAVIGKYLGEARFFRAFAYFEMVKRFGDVPLLLQTLTESDSILYTPRTDRNKVLSTVYADLDYAAAHCPQPNAQAAAEYGRITGTAALALESRVGLFEGTREKYFGAGDYTQHLNIAVQAANTIITEGKHALYVYPAVKDSSYYYLFQYAAEGSYSNNKETILPKLYSGTSSSSYITSHTFSVGIGQKSIVATKTLVNQYLYKDGLPQGKSAYYKAKEDSSLTEFLNRDPRAGMTIFNKNSFFQTSNFVPTTSYVLHKWYVYADQQVNYSTMDFMVIRYAEVLLNYAEALYELNGTISDEVLNKTINALRNRASNSSTAKLPLLTNAFVTANGLSMRDEIRRERNVELAMEGFHYWDLLRWKTAETELPKALLGPRFFPREMPGVAAPNINADSVIILESAANRVFHVNRDYLWPVPTQEIALTNSIYTQNPNW